jgi:hypothetical protein
MATYYFEGAKILAPLTIESNEPMFDTDTISLKKQRASQGAQRWELSFNTVYEEDAANAFLAGVVDLDTTSSMIMPQLRGIPENNTISGTVETATTQLSGNNSITIDNTISNSGILPKGSFINFSNHNKVYVTTSNLNLSGTTNQTLNFYPNLVTEVPSNTTVRHGNNCTLVYFRSIDNLQGLTFSDGILSNIGTINLIEAI